MTETKDPISKLITIMQRLRNPDGGCAWDLEQNFTTIAPYTIEEAYEVAEAIESGDMTHLKDELGDLLFQVIFHAQMAQEKGHFDFSDVAESICDKMIRRHPHVFGEEKVASVAAQSASWEAFKAEERAAKASADDGTPSALDGVTVGLPALARALKLQKRAARVGFDWPEAVQVFDKIDEELSEIKEEIENGSDPRRVEDEIGDLLFVVVNLARHLHVDPESALRHANGKFERRFRAMEQALAAGDRPLEQHSLEAMEAAWQAVKRGEK